MELKSDKIDFNESKNFVFKSYNCFFVVMVFTMDFDNVKI